MPNSEAIALAARGLSKAYPGVQAASNVSLEIRIGEVHALLGENGAGKSTVAHLLAGAQSPDSGHIEAFGEPVRFQSPRDAIRHGVGLVAQHFDLVDVMTVAENLLLADSRQPWRWSASKARERVAGIAARHGFPVNPSAVVGDLSLGERQQVEILRALHRGARVLILDEPTSVLTPQQSETLIVSLRDMARDGRSVVFISHKLTEVMSVADRITVMRDGRVIETLHPSETSPGHLAMSMVGRPVDLSRPKGRTSLGPTLLAVSKLNAPDENGRTGLSDIDLEVRGGEIVGIAGVSGNGQDLLANAITGLAPITSGTIKVGGQAVGDRGPVAARKAGMRYVPADRLGTGLAPGLSIAENVTLTEPKSMVLRHGPARERAKALIERFKVKPTDVETPVRHLSGGNAQKILLGRELGDHSDVAVVASPTWGLDVGAVEFVRNLLEQRRLDGGAVLLISEDLDEVCMLSDRIQVISRGRIVGTFEGPHYDISAIGLAMAGADTT